MTGLTVTSAGFGFHVLPEGRAATSCRRLFRCLKLTSRSCLLAPVAAQSTITL